MNLSLNHKLSQIGFRLSLRKKVRVSEKQKILIDIEETLIVAAREVPNDSKLFSLMASWVKVHGKHVLIEKLVKKWKGLDENDDAKIWIGGLFAYASSIGLHKWARHLKPSKVKHFLYGKTLTLSAVKLKGHIHVFEKYGFIIPNDSIRIRTDDALSPRELASQNQQYRNRLLFGACWRADIITAIEQGAQTPYAIAKKIGCSYEPAHRIFSEYQIAVI